MNRRRRAWPPPRVEELVLASVSVVAVAARSAGPVRAGVERGFVHPQPGLPPAPVLVISELKTPDSKLPCPSH